MALYFIYLFVGSRCPNRRPPVATQQRHGHSHKAWKMPPPGNSRCLRTMPRTLGEKMRLPLPPPCSEPPGGAPTESAASSGLCRVNQWGPCAGVSKRGKPAAGGLPVPLRMPLPLFKGIMLNLDLKRTTETNLFQHLLLGFNPQ